MKFFNFLCIKFDIFIIYSSYSIIKDSYFSMEHDTYMVLDVETGKWGAISEIIQLAYIIYDVNGQEIKSANRYIKNRYVEKRAFDVHGISSKFLQTYGEEFGQIMKDFVTDLKICSVIVGHNVSSDIKHIKTNLKKYLNIDIDIFANKKIHDTMKMGRNICDVVDKNGRKKNPTLGELYKYMLAEPMINAHNALIDCECTAKCYFLLK